MPGTKKSSSSADLWDDIDWSDTPRRRRASTEQDLTPESWITRGRADVSEARRSRGELGRWRDPVAATEAVAQREAERNAPQLVAEFDWDSADAHAIEDRIWGITAPDSLVEQTGGLLPALAGATTGSDEAVWGPRPRLQQEEPGGRRTVVITGRVADRYAAPRSGRSESRLPARLKDFSFGDRMAAWAVGLGLILLLVATLSGH